MRAQSIAGTTATVELVELEGQRIFLEDATSRHWLEVHISDFSPSRIKLFQVSIDTASFTSDANGTVSLAIESCCTDEQCEDRFGRGATCDNGGGGEGVCTPAFQDTVRVDWAFDDTGIPVPAPYTVMTGSAFSTGTVPDDGSERYAGTIVIDIAEWNPDVSQLFPINLLPPADTFITDSANIDIPLVVQGVTLRATPIGQCCVLSSASCFESLTPAQCDELGGLYFPGLTCTSPCVECIEDEACEDGSLCTHDDCTEFFFCRRTPAYDARTECCVPQTGAIFGGPDAKLDPCLQIVCDEQDQTWSFESFPVAAPCDDGDPCTQRTFCNSAGNCVGQSTWGPGCPKSRYLSFRMDQLEPTGCNDARAVRVIFVDLPGFDTFNGEVRWLSAPDVYPEVYVGETFSGASVECDPHFDVYGDSGLMHVFGAGVVPGATYEVQTVDSSCPDLSDPACYSTSLVVQMGAWGDVTKPFKSAEFLTQPDFRDIAAVVESFLQSNLAPIKARSQLQPNVPDPNTQVSFSDIAEVVDAFVTNFYPYAGPSSCP